MDLGLKGKVAMVAGASRGLNAARYITAASLQVDGGLTKSVT